MRWNQDSMGCPRPQTVLSQLCGSLQELKPQQEGTWKPRIKRSGQGDEDKSWDFGSFEVPHQGQETPGAIQGCWSLIVWGASTEQGSAGRVEKARSPQACSVEIPEARKKTLCKLSCKAVIFHTLQKLQSLYNNGLVPELSSFFTVSSLLYLQSELTSRLCHSMACSWQQLPLDKQYYNLPNGSLCFCEAEKCHKAKVSILHFSLISETTRKLSKFE